MEPNAEDRWIEFNTSGWVTCSACGKQIAKGWKKGKFTEEEFVCDEHVDSVCETLNWNHGGESGSRVYYSHRACFLGDALGSYWYTSSLECPPDEQCSYCTGLIREEPKI